MSELPRRSPRQSLHGQAPAVRLYGLLVGLLPRSHRDLFGDEMLDVFRRQRAGECRNARQRLFHLLRTSFDLLATAWILQAEKGLKRFFPGRQNPRERFRRGLEKGDFMTSWVSDIRFGLRNLVRSPLLVLVAVLTLGAGIGANTAIFSVLNTVLLRPMPFEEPGRLMHVYETNPIKGWTQQTASPANFLDWRAQSRSFQDMAGYWSFNATTVEVDGSRHRVVSGQATGSLFQLLGVQPAKGRLFREEETFQGGPNIAVISHSYWQSRFGGREDIVGTSLQTNAGSLEIAGVLPRGFRAPGSDVDPQVWTPSGWDPQVFGVAVWTRRAHWITVVGRLKEGVSIDQANQELQAIAANLEEQHPETNTEMGVGLIALQDWVAGEARLPLWLLMASVAAVLLIACINVANLLLARGRSRRREMAVRGALGAGRMRLLRQLLTEAMLLAGAAGVLGLALAFGGVAFLRTTAPAGIPRMEELSVDPQVLVFALLCSFVTLLVFGSLPAWSLSRTRASEGLRQGGRQGQSGGRSPFGRGLVVAEMALSVLLVVGAGLLMRSFLELQNEPTGFDPSSVLSMRIDLRDGQFESPQQALNFVHQLDTGLRSLPNVKNAALATSIPIGGDGTWSGTVFVEGQDNPIVEFRHRGINERYLPTLGVELLDGRNFQASDGPQGQRITLVNAAAAAGIEDGRVVGRRIRFSQEGDWLTVVGIVADEKYASVKSEPTPQVYQPLLQDPDPDVHILVQTEGDPAGVAGSARSLVPK